MDNVNLVVCQLSDSLDLCHVLDPREVLKVLGVLALDMESELSKAHVLRNVLASWSPVDHILPGGSLKRPGGPTLVPCTSYRNMVR